VFFAGWVYLPRLLFLAPTLFSPLEMLIAPYLLNSVVHHHYVKQQIILIGICLLHEVKQKTTMNEQLFTNILNLLAEAEISYTANGHS
jgi:hypothetical protein